MNEEHQRDLVHAFWIVGFVDLLGQRDALRKTDFMPDVGDPASVDTLIAAVKQSVGVIRGLYRHFDDFLKDDYGPPSGAPKVKELITQVRKNDLKRVNYADGIMLYCRLTPSENHYPPYAVYRILAAFGSAALIQLAKGQPIRAGVDVGTGIETDGQLFGASVVKAMSWNRR